MKNPSRKQLSRLLTLSALLLASALGLHSLDLSSATTVKQSLSAFPHSMGRYENVGGDQLMEAAVVDKLKVDDYVFRNYRGPDGERINFYASFFNYTDRSKGYHSPLNCMPGAGWQIADSSDIQIRTGSGEDRVSVKQLILRNGSRKQVLLYWYQCRGRIIDDEYTERIYRVLDSIFQGRTDGAFIRLTMHSSPGSLEKNSAMLQDFAGKVIPLLWEYIPK